MVPLLSMRFRSLRSRALIDVVLEPLVRGNGVRGRGNNLSLHVTFLVMGVQLGTGTIVP